MGNYSCDTDNLKTFTLVFYFHQAQHLELEPEESVSHEIFTIALQQNFSVNTMRDNYENRLHLLM